MDKIILRLCLRGDILEDDIYLIKQIEDGIKRLSKLEGYDNPKCIVKLTNSVAIEDELVIIPDGIERNVIPHASVDRVKVNFVLDKEDKNG